MRAIIAIHTVHVCKSDKYLYLYYLIYTINKMEEDIKVNKGYLFIGLLIAGIIFYFIMTMPVSDDFPQDGGYSVGYNYSQSSCLKHPEFCKYPLNLSNPIKDGFNGTN